MSLKIERHQNKLKKFGVISNLSRRCKVIRWAKILNSNIYTVCCGAPSLHRRSLKSKRACVGAWRGLFVYIERRRADLLCPYFSRIALCQSPSRFSPRQNFALGLFVLPRPQPQQYKNTP
ncbi:hypothetical protein EVAR_82572_1 [Eumeta japonica]|uniref:Uncharacterized protein n=1 Tax=Eumeta variegata TaxID=151549 RepID=A0A4C1UX69_EUMVA|nr:hypothetical protein EVAR_82572_1 [Eumeta japonica]